MRCDMHFITIFTCTYNRANLLSRVYKSLCLQTCTDFEWLIIDDGSTDETRNIVHQWIDENRLEITYIFKKNGGIHTGYNAAFQVINTELCMCVDSDDWLPEDAVANIQKIWNEKGGYKYSGIVGLNTDSSAKTIGSKLPKLESSPYRQLYTKHKITGDKKFVFRTDIMKSIPEYPEYTNEKLVPAGYKFIQIPDDKELLIINKPLCIVDYQSNGLSKGMKEQYFKSPKGMAAGYKTSMRYAYGVRQYVKSNIGYIVFSLIAKNRLFIKESPKPITTLLFLPIGYVGLFYVLARWGKYKVRKS